MEQRLSLVLQVVVVILLALILAKPAPRLPDYPEARDYRPQIERLTKMLGVICHDVEVQVLGDRVYPEPAC